MDFIFAKDFQPPSYPLVMAKKLGYLGGRPNLGAPPLPRFDASNGTIAASLAALTGKPTGTYSHQLKFPPGFLALHHWLSMPKQRSPLNDQFFN